MFMFVVVAPRFPFGRLVSTPNVQESVPHVEIAAALNRHGQCEWGNLCAEDKAANDRAFTCGGRLFSEYFSKTGVKFWIITEADRSATTVLLPEEY